MEVFKGLRVRMSLEAPASARKVKAFARGVEIQLGMRKPFLRDVQPNRIQLDDLYLLGATVGPAGAELRLARKPSGEGVVHLGLGLQQGVVTAVGSLSEGEEFDVPSDDRAALSILWRGLITEVADASRAPAQILEIHLDRDRVTDADDVFAALQRVVEHYRPIVADLAAHSPNADELSIKIEVEEGHREEVFVYRADLAQHILALPPGIRDSVTLRELVGGGRGIRARVRSDRSRRDRASRRGPRLRHHRPHAPRAARGRPLRPRHAAPRRRHPDRRRRGRSPSSSPTRRSQPAST